MRKGKFLTFLVTVLCAFALLIGMFGVSPLAATAAETTGNKVTATTNATVKQGNTAYCYIYIDSLESLSSLNVAVHYDPDKISVTSSFNQVSCVLYDSSTSESSIQYSYIFDGNGKATKTQLFYFQYKVLSNADLGGAYFDIVVSDAYDSSLNEADVTGSRCSFTIAETVTNKTCSISGTSSVSSAINGEFELSYRLNTTGVASGSFVIRYDAELFAFVGLTQGGLLSNKLVDVNTDLPGAIYISFVGTEYASSSQLLNVKFKTNKNVTETSQIKLSVTDFYDLELNSISCSGYTTSANVTFDPTYSENAPSMTVTTAYSQENNQVTLTVQLEANAHLGAGDFVLNFDPAYFAYHSATKGFSPTFFNINDKNVSEGVLKFSIISLSDIVSAETVLTVVFDTPVFCLDHTAEFTLTGSGLADSMTEPILLNFVDSTLSILGVGHDEISHDAQAPTCTEIGWHAYRTCSRCDYTTYEEIPANGHSYVDTFCSVCGEKQPAFKTWDISAAGDGALMGMLYQNYVDGGYTLEISGSGAMADFNYYGTTAAPWSNYRSSINRIVLPDGLTSIGAYAFYNCSKLESITIPENVAYIGNFAFYNTTGLKEIYFNAIAANDFGNENKVFAYAGQSGEGIKVILGAQVTKVPSDLFCPYRYDSNYLPKITEVVFEEGSACETIGDYAFYNCSGLESITIPENVTTIGSYAFYNCSGLESITMPENVTTIGSYAFGHCSKLESITIPENVTTIGSYAFYNTTGLKEIYFNAIAANDFGSDNYVFTYAGQSGEGIKVIFGAQVTKVPNYLFNPYGSTSYAPKITKVVFEEGSACETIGAYAFYSCSGLESITMPENVTTIGSYAFGHCSKLESITIPENVTTIGSYAFHNTTGLKEICFNAIAANDFGSDNYVFTYAGQSGEGIKVIFGAQVTKVPNYLFCPYGSTSRATKITEVVFEEGSACETIGAYAFYRCSGLKSITIPENVTSIGSYAFYNVGAKLVYIYSGKIAADVIDAAAFGNLLNGNTTVVIPADITDVSSFITNYYANDETVIYDGVAYTVYSKHTHDWTEYAELISHIACVQDGCIRYVCADCGAFKDVTVFRHDVIVNAAKEPTCLQIGWTEYHTCANCDYTTYAEQPALGHDLIHYDGKAPTCLDIGWYAYDACSRCDYTTYAELPALGHDLTHHDAQEVTCLEIGWDAYDTCSRCDYTTYAEQPALGHDLIHHDAKDPTCLDIGWYAYDTCSRCDYTTYVEIPATGHWIFNIQEENDPTYPFAFDGKVFASTNKLHGSTSVYTITAKRNFTIVVFGKTSSESGYDKLLIAHNGSQIAELSGECGWTQYSVSLQAGDMLTISYRKDSSVSNGQDTVWFRYEVSEEGKIPGEDGEPTCTNPVICCCCGETLKEALGHDLTHHNAQEVTCLEIGWDAYDTCSRCDYTTYAEIPALGHDLIHHDGKAPTCLDIGWYAYDACSRCDYTTYAEIPALGHDLIHHDGKAPTCLDIGWNAYDTCSRCDYTTYAEIPANGHSFVQTVCTACGVKQTPLYTWDVSAAGDGSLVAGLYRNYVDGGYELEITGSGAMADFNYYGTTVAPWSNYNSSINRIVLPDGLTSIGKYAFHRCDALRQISIPCTVTRINRDAFSHCSALRQISIPASVQQIDSYAFEYAEKLVILLEGNTMPTTALYWNRGCSYYLQPQKVILEENATYVIDRDGNACLAKYIGNSAEFVARETVDGIPVTHIGEYAFYNQSNLRYYWITQQIECVGKDAFDGCDRIAVLMEQETLPAGFASGWNSSCDYYPGAEIWDEDGFLFVRDTSGRVDLICYQGDAREITVPAQPGGYPLSRIRNYTFYGSNVTKVVLPEGITSIGVSAFGSCSSLQEIYLPESLTEINTEAFSNCSRLKAISLPKNLRVLGYQAFWYCSALQEVVIPNGITEMNSSTFVCCTALKKVVLPEGLTKMGFMEFYGCSSLQEINLPDSLRSVGSNCFYNCSSLTSITLPAQLHSLSNANIFDGCRALRLVYIRSAQLAAELTATNTAALASIKNAVTVVVPAGTGTEYLQSTYPYCETIQIDGASYDVYSLHEHTWQEEVLSEFVICQNDGLVVYTCEDCGVEKTMFTPCHNIVQYEAKTVTCTENGWDAYEACTRCDYTTYVEIAAPGHDEELHVVKQPTCTETGMIEDKVCLTCGEVTVLWQEIPALGHTPREAVMENETATSYESVVYCDTCSAELHRETLCKHAYSNDNDAVCNNCGFVRQMVDEFKFENYRVVFSDSDTTHKNVRAVIYTLGDQTVADPTNEKALKAIDPNAVTKWGSKNINRILLTDAGNYVILLKYNIGTATVSVPLVVTVTADPKLIIDSDNKITVLDDDETHINHRVVVYYIGDNTVEDIYDVNALTAIDAAPKTVWQKTRINRLALTQGGTYVLHLQYNIGNSSAYTVAQQFTVFGIPELSIDQNNMFHVVDENAGNTNHRVTIFTMGDAVVEDPFDETAVAAAAISSRTVWGLSSINEIEITEAGNYIVQLYYNVNGGAKRTLALEATLYERPVLTVTEDNKLNATYVDTTVITNPRATYYYLGEQSLDGLDIYDANNLKAICEKTGTIWGLSAVNKKVLTDRGNYVIHFIYNEKVDGAGSVAKTVALATTIYDITKPTLTLSADNTLVFGNTNADATNFRATIYSLGSETVADPTDEDALKAIDSAPVTKWSVDAINATQLTEAGNYVVLLKYNLGTSVRTVAVQLSI